MNAYAPKRLLVVSYAFPPMQTQMSPTVAKPMAGLAALGWKIDVVCANPFSGYLGRDDSLLPYVKTHFGQVFRLQPPNSLFEKIRVRLPVIATTPDLMAILQGAAYRLLMSLDLDQYRSVITWSPFHSINPVLVKVKERHPNLRWIAQFSDPWAANPLEQNRVIKLWSRWNEPKMVSAADFIVHSSKFSLDLMERSHPGQVNHKSAVIAHPFDEELFPQRPRVRNNQITMRYVGVLFGRRSPEPLFLALNTLFDRRPELKGGLCVEIVGEVPKSMLETSAAASLPNGTIRHVPSVSYLKSLENMYDSDILLLIEADVRENLFVPSKLSDYIGSGTPIVGIAPAGGSWDVLEKLDCWRARPGDIAGISHAIGAAVDHVSNRHGDPWCNETFRMTYSRDAIAEQFANVIERM
ncbi:MAG: glycosyltransferase family 4 protein [Betaproteobacteria bacterium]|nr:glycosyltransferase family 4 protein [Betaproteobacteria bacterium]